MTGRDDADRGARVHRALASDVRTRLVEVLRSEPGLDASELADRLGLHVNTIRSHLAVLEEAGLVEVATEDRDRPGRPRRLHRVVEGVLPAGDGGGRAYRFLAEVLAGYLDATSADPGGAAEQAGTAWGRFVVDAPPPFTTLDGPAAVARLVRVLDDLGFAPVVETGTGDERQVVLRRCPFIEVAREHQDVVCSVHLGLMRGALAELGGDVEVLDLIPWARPDACVSHLRVAAG